MEIFVEEGIRGNSGSVQVDIGVGRGECECHTCDNKYNDLHWSDDLAERCVMVMYRCKLCTK